MLTSTAAWRVAVMMMTSWTTTTPTTVRLTSTNALQAHVRMEENVWTKWAGMNATVGLHTLLVISVIIVNIGEAIAAPTCVDMEQVVRQFFKVVRVGRDL